MYTINPTTGIVTRQSDGHQVAPAQSTDDIDFITYNEWVAAGNTPQEIFGSVEYETRHITKLAFRTRFTTSEKIIIELASLDNPIAPMDQRQLAAALRVYIKDLDNAAYVDLAGPDTVSGIHQLVALGLLAPERATVILDTPVQPHEIPGG